MRIVIIIKGTKIQQPTTAYVTTTTTIKTNSLKIINWLIYTLYDNCINGTLFYQKSTIWLQKLLPTATLTTTPS